MNIIQAIKKAYEDKCNLLGFGKNNENKEILYHVSCNGNELILSKDGQQWRIDLNATDFKTYYQDK